MRSLFIRWHLGLGDALICNGLVRTLADNYDLIFVPCKFHNITSIRLMFSDAPKIIVLPVKDDHEADELSRILCAYGTVALMTLGMFRRESYDVKPGWDREFYEHAGVPFENRWSKFSAPNPIEKHNYFPAPRVGYRRAAFVHHDSVRGFTIHGSLFPRDIPISNVYNKPTIFHWMDDIMTCSEIHCIDSCFAILADSIPTVATKLVLHKYARKSIPPIYKKNWTILD